MQVYSDPKRASDPHALPDVEVFYNDKLSSDPILCFDENDTCVARDSGWYWWPCFPGCLPDGDPVGPFDSKMEAIQDAQEGCDDEE